MKYKLFDKSINIMNTNWIILPKTFSLYKNKYLIVSYRLDMEYKDSKVCKVICFFFNYLIQLSPSGICISVLCFARKIQYKIKRLPIIRKIKLHLETEVSNLIFFIKNYLWTWRCCLVSWYSWRIVCNWFSW